MHKKGINSGENVIFSIKVGILIIFPLKNFEGMKNTYTFATAKK